MRNPCEEIVIAGIVQLARMASMTPSVTLRWMTAKSATTDAEALLIAIRDLAVFEGWADRVTVTADQIVARAAETPPRSRALLAWSEDALAGFATLFDIPYAYADRPSLELEMLFVAEPYRARGVGRALMTEIIAFARTGNYERVEWNVLADNARAQAFYKSLGAAEKDGWRRWGISL